MAGIGRTRTRQRIPSWYFIYLLIFTLKLNIRSKMASSFDKLFPRLRVSGRPE